MNAVEIRKRFLDFFAKNGHAVIASSSLIPSDPSVLLTTAGMQQFKPYYTGDADALRDFGAKSTASCQKSFRTSDIDEVGDERHLTFFEMLGNFSFGGYGKREAIMLAHAFITKEMGLPISYVTVFEGSASVPRDEESAGIWKELGVSDIRYEGMEDVFWGPTGSSGPCGPTTEIYCKNGAGQDIEIWNIVFNQFFYNGSREDLLSAAPGKELAPLTQFGVDTGMGIERLVMVSQGTKTIFETDLFSGLVALLSHNTDGRITRIFADHARAICFLVSDGVRPSNKGAGYVLRRLMRRIIAQGVDLSVFSTLANEIVVSYVSAYPELALDTIVAVFSDECAKFQKTMAQGARELNKMETVTAEAAFKLFESYGLPYEVIKEMAPQKTKDLTRSEFNRAFERHQEASRAGLEKKFGGHGLVLDTGELKAGSAEELQKVTRLHTATHLLQQALRDVLGSEVEQRGSDITAERLRFDFSFSRKVTTEELKKVEDIVNAKVEEDMPVSFVELPISEAKKTGALYYFKEKYPDTVKVYYAGNSLDAAYSKEFCGGPHVTHTGTVGAFKIIKEEAVSQGIRRIRAIVQ
jgi:alanyl-tRNA synthetase